MSRPSEKKRVLVIGGGPAGMKAAITAAGRGHKVTLVERGDRLGGQFLLNRAIPGRKEIATAAEDLADNLSASDVQVLLQRNGDVSMIKEMAADVVVLATGAKPIVPDIPGVDHPKVVRAWDLLRGNTRAGQRVVVIGGNAVGLETALYLASHGSISPETLYFLAANRAEPWHVLEDLISRSNRDITVVEMTRRSGQGLGNSTRWTVMAELRRFGVKVRTGSEAKEIGETGVTVETGKGTELLEADTVVLAVGARPENSLWPDVRILAPECYLIGDAKEPRNGLEALREGFRVGLRI